MKKSFKKLDLNKSTIANLDSGEMNQRVGGFSTTANVCCAPTHRYNCITKKKSCHGYTTC